MNLGILGPPGYGARDTWRLPRGYIDGLILSNNVADANKDIDISAGVVRSSDNLADIELSSALTKQIDVNWVPGNNQGGLRAGLALATSTWYHVHAIYSPSLRLSDVLFDTGVTPTLPAEWTHSQRIGAVLTDSSANIRAFTQMGSEFLWDGAVEDSDTTVGTTSVSVALRVPTGLKVNAVITSQVTGSAKIAVTSLDTVEQAVPTGYDGGFGIFGLTSLRQMIRTNTSAQVRVRGQASSQAYAILTHGWIDPRGRDA